MKHSKQYKAIRRIVAINNEIEILQNVWTAVFELSMRDITSDKDYGTILISIERIQDELIKEGGKLKSLI